METIEWHDVQGLVLSGYPKLKASAYVLWRFIPGAPLDPAKKWLADLAGRLMRAEPGDSRAGHARGRHLKAVKREEERCAINLALTASGLKYLGLDDPALSQFSLEFLEGMSPLSGDGGPVPRRTNALGDVGDSSPQFWNWGGWRNNRDIDGVLLLFAANQEELGALIQAELAFMAGAANQIGPVLTAWVHGPDEPEHFGYVDGLSQPIIKGSPKARESKKRSRAPSPACESRLHNPEEQRILFVEPGEFLLGYLNERRARVGDGAPGAASPWTAYGRDLRRNGTYLVFRQLEQNVSRFNQFLSATAARLGATVAQPMIDEIAGKLLGRRRDGTPMVRCRPGAVNPRRQNDFLYYFEDRHGISCPIGAHIRRANPRDSIGPDPDTALRLSKMHRIIRRGRPYGERLELTEPAAQDGDGERGMFFICLNADIAGQFELIQHSWLNNPHFAGLHTGIDPFSHIEDPDNSLVIQSRPINLNIPRPHPFVKVRGGAYFFLPGIEAVQALAQ